MIHLLDLAAQTQGIRDELREAISGVIDSGTFILGPNVARFEEELAAYCGVRFAVGVANGTDALVISLRALNIGPGDEVAVPAFTFFASASCAWLVGARPRFVDVEPDTYGLDPACLRRTLGEGHRVKAIVVVHLYGQPCRIDEVSGVAAEFGVPVIEDAAQAISSSWRGVGVGCFGEAACLSFFPSKNLGAFGDGGAVLTNNEAVADRVRLLRVHGMRPRYFHHEVGYNSRLDELQAAILRVKLRHLESWVEGRRRRARVYHDLFTEAGLDKVVTLPVERPGSRHVYHQYTIQIPARDHVKAALLERGIETAIYYPLPLHLQEAFASLGHARGEFPVSESLAEKVLSLPIYPELRRRDQERVVTETASLLSEGAVASCRK